MHMHQGGPEKEQSQDSLAPSISARLMRGAATPSRLPQTPGTPRHQHKLPRCPACAVSSPGPAERHMSNCRSSMVTGIPMETSALTHVVSGIKGSSLMRPQWHEVRCSQTKALTAVCSRAPIGQVSAAAMASETEWPLPSPACRSTSNRRASVPACIDHLLMQCRPQCSQAIAIASGWHAWEWLLCSIFVESTKFSMACAPTRGARSAWRLTFASEARFMAVVESSNWAPTHQSLKSGLLRNLASACGLQLQQHGSRTNSTHACF